MKNCKYARVSQYAINFIKENNDKYTFKELEKKLGLSLFILRKLCKLHGIKKQHKKYVKYGPLNNKASLRKKMILFLLEKGSYSYEEIGILMNCSRQNVCQIVNTREKKNANVY